MLYVVSSISTTTVLTPIDWEKEQAEAYPGSRTFGVREINVGFFQHPLADSDALPSRFYEAHPGDWDEEPEREQFMMSDTPREFREMGDTNYAAVHANWIQRNNVSSEQREARDALPDLPGGRERGVALVDPVRPLACRVSV